ncbi:NAD(P)-binding protein [Teratosphaeria destructans]|uniref:enoyl-[acyl-carrier-protein] reductase n=1 Tax=Teratosphaeria destructans TaxID=418781 RepID=A0A9W7SV85_9PEZI|nr:NAD(P)-binding protein [Teratosphaeria destructans]
MAPYALTFKHESEEVANAIEASPCGVDERLEQLPSDHVLVRFLAFPINPQDLLAVAGRYPVRPRDTLPDGSRVAGNDGVGRVERVGRDVTTLKPGDIVLPKRHGLGTWRELAVLPAAELLMIPPHIQPVAAALLKMGFAPAYLLLEDIRTLRPGDWIVVNAGSGVIPQMIAQFAKLRGCHTVATIRDRDGLDDVRAMLRAHGADLVVTEEALSAHGPGADATLSRLVAEARIVLAADCVFGHSGDLIAHLLAPGGDLCPDGIVPLSQELLFWRQIKFVHFRLSQQLSTRSDDEQERLFGWFVALIAAGRLVPPVVDVVDWDPDDPQALTDTARTALERATRRGVGTRKQVFSLIHVLC